MTQYLKILESPANPHPVERGWHAGLKLGLQVSGERTVLKTVDHIGPLRVQRPFYPEGAPCHVYLLHPPGGMVGGDSLAIALKLEQRAHSLVTTPAAGKLYRVANGVEPQYQGVKARLAEGAVLEWLPQETIIFDGARGELLSRFDLAGDAVLIGWDIVCLGRRASGETFESGEVTQKIQVYRDDKPVFIDRVRFEGGGTVLGQPWGMNTKTVSGTLFVSVLGDVPLSVDEFRAALFETVAEDTPERHHWGLSVKGGGRSGQLLLVRYLGDSAERCRQGFERIWGLLRPALLSRPVARPRIWNT